MKIIHLNDKIEPSFPESLEKTKPKYIITYYIDNVYDGSGTAFAIFSKNKIYEKNLSHCSCFHGFDTIEGHDWVKTNYKNILSDYQVVSETDYNYNLCTKVLETLKEIFK